MIEVVAGTTAPLYRYLKIDEALPTNPDGTALSMSGMTVSAIVHDLSGVAITISGTCSIQNADTWLVKFSPAAGDYIVGQWRFRFQVTDGSGAKDYFPNGLWEDLIVRAS
jgi:hypothetical protein